jgi:hypothetical protein
MIEVIDQYGCRHRFSDDHFFDRYDERVDVMLEQNDELRCVATFPYPAWFGIVGAEECFTMREVPPGVARELAALRQQLQAGCARTTQADRAIDEISAFVGMIKIQKSLGAAKQLASAAIAEIVKYRKGVKS